MRLPFPTQMTRSFEFMPTGNKRRISGTRNVGKRHVGENGEKTISTKETNVEFSEEKEKKREK